jgi:hypothetical protein
MILLKSIETSILVAVLHAAAEDKFSAPPPPTF